MPILSDWDDRTGLLIRVWAGVVDAEEWARVAPTAWEYPGMHRMLVDLTRWDRDPSFDAERVQRMAGALAAADGAHPIRLAIVAGSQFRAAQEFEAALTRGGTVTAVVSGVDVACAWLGLDLVEITRRVDAMHADEAGDGLGASGNDNGDPTVV